jgi:hypothetical protein
MSNRTILHAKKILRADTVYSDWMLAQMSRREIINDIARIWQATALRRRDMSTNLPEYAQPEESIRLLLGKLRELDVLAPSNTIH